MPRRVVSLNLISTKYNLERDASDFNKWHVTWNDSTYRILRNDFMTSGYGVANWERGNSSDSGYAIWNGMEWMDVNHNFHLWDSVCYYYGPSGSSPPYGLHVITTGWNIQVDATPNGQACP